MFTIVQKLGILLAIVAQHHAELHPLMQEAGEPREGVRGPTTATSADNRDITPGTVARDSDSLEVVDEAEPLHEEGIKPATKSDRRMIPGTTHPVRPTLMDIHNGRPVHKSATAAQYDQNQQGN